MTAKRHLFLFEIDHHDGTKTNLRALAKVRTPKHMVEVILTEEHVLHSMRMNGVGSTQKCSAAVCMVENADKFDHRVAGYVDYFHSTCFVVSKLDRESRLPSECYRYMHNYAWIAKLNDKKGGQKELLEIIRRDGPIVIRLWPRNRTPTYTREGGTGRRDGTRSTRLTGAKLRHAEAMLGGVP
jgi:hypothetical protein